MVTVVPPKMNLGSHIGQGAARGLERGFSEGFDIARQRAEQQYQRGMLQNALTEAQQIFNDPNASQSDKLFAYKKAYAGLNQMGGDRAEASLIPHLLAASGGARGVNNAPDLNANNQRAVEQLDRSAAMQEGSQDRGLERPTEPGIGLPKHYSPEEINQAQSEDIKNGFFEAPTAKLMKERNATIDEEQARRNKQGMEHAQLAAARTAQEDQFIQFAKNRNTKLSDPNNEAVFNEIAQRPKIANIDDQVKRFNAANELFNLYDHAKKNILETGQRANFQPDKYNETINSLKTTMKPLLESGLRGVAENLLAENGYGRVEISRILNDLDPQQKSLMSKAPSFDAYRKDKEAFDSVSRYYSPQKREQEEKRLNETKEKSLIEWEKNLENIIKPGGQSKKNSHVFNPGTDLLILRDDFMKKGGAAVDFNNSILKLIEEGKIELDAYQQGQLPLLKTSPRQLMGIGQILMNGIPGYIERN